MVMQHPRLDGVALSGRTRGTGAEPTTRICWARSRCSAILITQSRLRGEEDGPWDRRDDPIELDEAITPRVSEPYTRK